jgi:hypothetical protein
MYPSANLCREQETIQRDRAASTSLENVRIVAERAANAWGAEALAAEKREARHERTREVALNLASMTNDGGELPSENPDREFADAGPLTQEGAR